MYQGYTKAEEIEDGLQAHARETTASTTGTIRHRFLWPVIVDLFSRETFLEYLPNRQQEGVCAALLKRIVYADGVPKQIRSDNAPELMQGIVRQLCAYLDIAQVVTGGHNPRGNSICERVNQTLGAMIRKLSDFEYKD